MVDGKINKCNYLVYFLFCWKIVVEFVKDYFIEYTCVVGVGIFCWLFDIFWFVWFIILRELVGKLLVDGVGYRVGFIIV